MDGKEHIFATLKQLADLVTRMFGDNCEIAVHDLTSKNKGLIYLTGNVTNREPGSPVTDAVVKHLVQDGNKVMDRHCFMTLTDDGRELKSSTSYIRDTTGEVIAAFCINFNTTDHHNAIQLLEAFLNRGVLSEPSMDEPEKISFSINNTMDSLFEQAVEEIGKRPASMTTDEKVRLVKILESKGAFQIRGMVNQVALRLGVSNFTIYNYLKKIRATKGTAIKDVI
ncbi:PAS domain-containing protein [Desulfobacterales bacterium HSG17]|nr:PAS domain-containing protein [Desulfobacterales bacterium HSG17]